MSRRKWDYETIQQVLDGQNPFIQVGYAPPEPTHKTGDIWTDARGDTWEQKNGYRVNVNTQADSIRDLVKRKCSVCQKDLDLFGDKVDDRLYSKTGKCFVCLDAEEMELKMTGKYQNYENLKILRNKLSHARELQKNILESIEYLKTDNCKLQMVMSNGDIETWTGAQNASLLEEAEKDLVELTKIIEELTASCESLEQS
jgi:hypothetical protein